MCWLPDRKFDVFVVLCARCTWLVLLEALREARKHAPWDDFLSQLPPKRLGEICYTMKMVTLEIWRRDVSPSTRTRYVGNSELSRSPLSRNPALTFLRGVRVVLRVHRTKQDLFSFLTMTVPPQERSIFLVLVACPIAGIQLLFISRPFLMDVATASKPQMLYLSGMKNQHERWACCMYLGNNDG